VSVISEEENRLSVVGVNYMLRVAVRT
jgi:hypothetical protein